MRKVLTFILFAGITTLALAENYITVVDSTDNGPVIGASVISGNGLIIGVTDNNGQINVSDTDFPLSFRSLGYEGCTVDNIKTDSVFLVPATYSLSEIFVSPADRPITRVVTYAREYCSGATSSDTLQMYCEYMLEYFFADGKVKGYNKSHKMPKMMAVKRYGRMANAAGLDSVMRPRYDDDITTISFIDNILSVPYEQVELTDILKNGALTDTIQGKYFPKIVYRLNNGYFTVDCDALSDFKNHTFSPWFFKVLGLTMEMQEFNWTYIYLQNDSDKYGISDFIYGTYNMHILAKGKLLRKMIGVQDHMYINCYIEQYPVEVQHLTVDDYKEMKKTYYERTENFRLPANVQPLLPAVQTLIDRVDHEIPKKK